MSQKAIAVFLAGFLSGVFLRSFLNFGWPGAGFFAFLGLAICAVSFLSKNKRPILLIAVFLIAMALGMGRYEIKDYKNTAALEQKVGQKVILEGVIIDEPDERENYTRYIVEADNAKILVYFYHYPEFNYGDEIKITGILKRPQNFSNEFDWQTYLAKDEIFYEIFYPEIELVSTGKGSWIKEKLFSLKNNFISALSRVIPEPHSAFMAGLTVGAKKSIPKDLQEDFRKTGIIHVVVLSGYNITLVADFVMKIFSFLPRIFGISLGVAGIILFAIMTGASATVARASIMALLVILARATGRIYQITWALFLTGFFMVLQNPKILVFDTGFQLSFLATLALIWLAPFFDPVRNKTSLMSADVSLIHRISNGVRKIAADTIATQIFVLPLLLYKMGLFSLVALPANLLILIFVPATMFFGFVTGGIGMLSEIISIPFGWLSYAFLQYELWIVDFFANLPASSFAIKNFPLLLAVLIYIFYGAVIYKIKKAEEIRR